MTYEYDTPGVDLDQLPGQSRPEVLASLGVPSTPAQSVPSLGLQLGGVAVIWTLLMIVAFVILLQQQKNAPLMGGQQG